MSVLMRHKYLALLLALIFLLVGYPILGGREGSPLLFKVLLTTVILASLLVMIADRELRLLALVLALPAVVGAWTGYVLPDLPRPTAEIGLHLSGAVFLSFMVVVLLRTVFREKFVTTDGIFGAFCGYLLTGVAFGHAYCLIEAALPGSFRGIPDGDWEQFLFAYFSFTTLTTLGYGDIIPTGGAARALAVIEAVTGQFYVAVLVAELIARRVSQPAPAPPTPGAAPEPPRSISGPG
jgi:voltage-gated potassium channel